VIKEVGFGIRRTVPNAIQSNISSNMCSVEMASSKPKGMRYVSTLTAFYCKIYVILTAPIDRLFLEEAVILQDRPSPESFPNKLSRDHTFEGISH
jgi:hypothetical protein